MALQVLLLPAAAAVLALFALAVWRPPLACALLALAIPVTAGLPRGAVVPLLRVNEGLLLVVAAGFLVHFVARRRPLTFTGLDVVVLGFCATNVLVASAVILLSRAPAELADWTAVLGPVQYLVVYVLYSRIQPAGADLRMLLNLCMLASIPVAAVAVAEALDLAGVRQLVGAYYPSLPLQPNEVYRPESLLGHYSAVGAFGLLNLVLALALAVMRHPGFSSWWLAVVIGANLLSLLSSQTYAPLAALPLAASVVVLAGRRVPWRTLAGGVPVLAASVVALWPSISGRIAAQFSGAGSSGGIGIPETLQTRIDYWQGFFVPGLLRHGPWLGTGTLIPPEVPRPLVDFVDNGYLAELFRAGVPGLAALLLLLAAVAGAGWAARTSPDPSRRVLGCVCAAAVVSVLLLSVTAEYMTFTAVSQEFWMLTGLLAGTLLAPRAAAGRPVIVIRPQPAPRGSSRLASTLARLGPERVVARASLAVLVGFGLARALGFLFQVAAGRLLSLDGYGRLTYALAVANVAAVLLTTAPLGLSRFLSRSDGSRGEQEAYYVNWLAVVGLLLGVSAAVVALAAVPLGLGGWLLLGVLANLLGAAALETYREVLRGLGRYTLQSVFYVLANLLQLAAVLLAAALGWRTPALFLTIYGLSSVAALALLAPLWRGPHLARAALRWSRMLGVAGFLRPLLLQAVFWNVWFNADLILVQHLRTAAETGAYGAAKTIANGFTLIPTALAFVLAPRLARMPEREVRGHVVRLLALTTAVTVPLAAGVMALAGPLTGGLFGDRYAAAALPLTVLVAGMVPYGLKTVLGSVWLGLGHPAVEAASSGAGMAVTLGLGVWLIPAGGPAAAAIAFSAGALAQLLVDGAVAAWAFGAASPRIRHLGDRRILEPQGSPRAGRAGAGPLPLVVARVRRLAVDWRGYPRRLVWGRRLGYLPRQASTAPISPVEEPARTAGPVPPAGAGPVGVVEPAAGGRVLVAAAAELLGLPLEAVGPEQTAPLVHRALAGRWRLVSAPVEALAGLPETGLAALATFVHRGGTLHLEGLNERSNGPLEALGRRLGFPPPVVHGTWRADRLRFPGEQAAYARELAGTQLSTAGGACVLRPAPGAEVLALHVDGGTARPALVRQRVGQGWIVSSTVHRAGGQRLHDLLASERAGAALAPLLLLRALYGAACWHPPAPLVNFSIDDPALRPGLLGLPYDRLVAQARDHGFHVTIATVPRELVLAEESVVRHLRARPGVLSACYHGCDHEGYEFYLTQGSHRRYVSRPLAEQRRALWRAVEHGRRFARVHGHQLDRVMVFPYGVGPASLFPDLERLGFLATCNYGDKYPLEAPVPPDPDLGLRPADVAWEGFPLLWRRSLDDDGYLLDLVLGRPLLLFAHRRELGRDFGPFVERARAIRHATGDTAVWRPLEEVARHAYLQRQDPAAGWQVLMTANEACLHNPDPNPREYTVVRPHLPGGRSFEVDGQPRESGQPLPVTVPPGGTALVRLVTADVAPPLAGRQRCSVFGLTAKPGRLEDGAAEVPR